jgi:hypothetical protein
MTDSDVVGLYEQMLYERAVRGIRPLLYISSTKDLECSVIMLLNKAPGIDLAGCHQAAAPEFGQHVRKV